MTENLKDFPSAILGPLNLEAKSANAFIADTIALETASAVQAIQRMRLRFKKPELSAGQLLLEMDARGPTETVDVLRLRSADLMQVFHAANLLAGDCTLWLRCGSDKAPRTATCLVTAKPVGEDYGAIA